LNLCYFGISQSFEKDIRDALKKKPLLDLRLDSRHSFINQAGVSMFGIKAGVEFDQKLRFGIGFNILTTDLFTTIAFIDNGLIKTSNDARLTFYNFSPYVEYVFYKDDRWEISIPVQFGLGNSYYSLKTNNGRINRNRHLTLSYEPAITAQYKLLKYFGPGFGVGYRLMIVDNKAIKESFNSPVYIFRFKIFFGEIYNDLKK
jgi:hypothetical protein